MHQDRSYVLALEHAGNLSGMYIGDEKDSLSFRQYENYLLLGGMGHRTGENKEGNCYERLWEAANRMYPGCRVAGRWSAQDCTTTDKVPLIGMYSSARPNWFVATGFRKWGMTSSMVSAMILTDLISGKENPYAKVFTPSRFSMEDIPQLAGDTGKSLKGLSKSFFGIPKDVKVCSHLGCALEWNPDEHSWDCPCHGSRFDKEGNVLDGPAQKKI